MIRRAVRWFAVLTVLPLVAVVPSVARAADAKRAADPPCPIATAPPLPGAKPRPKPTLPPPPDGTSDVGGERLASDGLVLPDKAPPLPGGLTARSWIVADLDSGEVLAACAPHAKHAPASTQKLLTALVTIPRVNKNQTITVTEQDLDYEPGSSAVGLVKGGRYTVPTLFLGLLLVSGNDAANTVARLAGGPNGVQGTIRTMNDEAKQLGALDTHAVTPSGLDAAGQWSSAYDLALIERADLRNADFRYYSRTPRAQIPPQKPKFAGYQIQNDNRLLTNYPGAFAGKTGFTDFARHTYVGAAERNGRRLVVTMMAGESRPSKLWQQAATLLDWGFALDKGAGEVGRLVDRGETDRAEQPSARATATTKAQQVRTDEGTPTGLIAGGAIGVTLLLAGLGLLAWRLVPRGRPPGRRPRRSP